MDNYERALRYANVLIWSWLGTYTPKDLVHDAWIQYYKYTQEDLFGKDIGTILKCIKNTNLNNYRKTYSLNGETKQYRVFTDYNDQSENDITTHDQVYASKDLENNFRNSLKAKLIADRGTKANNTNDEKTIEVFDLQVKGYTAKDIAEILNVSNQVINYHRNKIKDKLTNPFTANKAEVIKRVKRETFEENPKYKEQFEMGEWSDSNEYYTLMTSKEDSLKGLLIREVPNHRYYEKLGG